MPARAPLNAGPRMNPSPNADAGPDGAVCGTSYVMQAAIDVVGGSWSAPIGGTFNHPTDAHDTVFVAGPGIYPFVWTVGLGGCYATDTVMITFHDENILLWANAGPDQNIDVSTSTYMAGAVIPGATASWSVMQGSGLFDQVHDTATLVTGLSVGDNIFVLSASIGSCATASDTMVVHVNDIFIPQGYSPNGDGVNDVFEITGIGTFPDCDLKVFNRWGAEVIGTHGYHNEWGGYGSNGQPLPDDTYFYVLNLTADRAYNGYVVIKR